MAAKILLIEDNPADIRLAQRALRQLDPEVHLKVIETGTQAMAAIAGFQPKALPQLILLDLNLPEPDGKVLLRHLRSRFDNEELPVIMLSNSIRWPDVVDAYALGANAYVTKASQFAEFKRHLRAVMGYFL